MKTVTARIWLGSPQNFAKTRFRRFRTFRFSTPKKFFRRKFRIGKFCFSPIWRGFGRATAERMSKSACSSNFALDRLIERPVRPKILGFGENLGFLKNFHSIVGDRFSGGTFSTASYRFKRHYYLTTKSLMLDPT